MFFFKFKSYVVFTVGVLFFYFQERKSQCIGQGGLIHDCRHKKKPTDGSKTKASYNLKTGHLLSKMPLKKQLVPTHLNDSLE